MKRIIKKIYEKGIFVTTASILLFILNFNVKMYALILKPLFGIEPTDTTIVNVVYALILTTLIIATAFLLVYVYQRWSLSSKFMKLGIRDLNHIGDASGARTTEYEELRKRAKTQMLIMGIGMTQISTNLDLIERQLKKGIRVHILMMNPDSFAARFCQMTENNQCDHYANIHQEYFEGYFNRRGYFKELVQSYNRLFDFVKNNKTQFADLIEMRLYSEFYPVNLTMIDDTPNCEGELIIEYCLPLSTDRIRFLVTQENKPNFFDPCRISIRRIWDDAVSATKHYP